MCDFPSNKKLFSRGFFNHSGFDDREAERRERITTDEDIDAIRGIDVSGQNGEAYILSYNPRNIELLFSSDGAGKGFNFSLELYTNRNTDSDGGAVTKRVSLILLTTSMFIASTYFTNLL